MSISDDLRNAIQRHYSAEKVKVMSSEASGADEVYAYGMLPDSTITGWYSLGDLDALERELQERGEL